MIAKGTNICSAYICRSVVFIQWWDLGGFQRFLETPFRTSFIIFLMSLLYNMKSFAYCYYLFLLFSKNVIKNCQAVRLSKVQQFFSFSIRCPKPLMTFFKSHVCLDHVTVHVSSNNNQLIRRNFLDNQFEITPKWDFLKHITACLRRACTDDVSNSTINDNFYYH